MWSIVRLFGKKSLLIRRCSYDICELFVTKFKSVVHGGDKQKRTGPVLSCRSYIVHPYTMRS